MKATARGGRCRSLVFFAAALGLALSSTAPGQMNERDLESCKAAVRERPEDAGAYSSLGAAYYEMGRYNEAAESYSQAVHLDPSGAEARFWLSMSYIQAGDKDRAKEEYKKLKEMDKDGAKRLKEMMEAVEDERKEAEKAREKAEKEAEKAAVKAAKEERKQEKERLKKKAKLLGISVREVQEQEFWEEYWARYRQADPATQAVMRYQMDVYLKRREVAAQEDMARAAREAAAAAWWSSSYRPYWYDPFYCW